VGFTLGPVTLCSRLVAAAMEEMPDVDLVLRKWIPHIRWKRSPPAGWMQAPCGYPLTAAEWNWRA